MDPVQEYVAKKVDAKVLSICTMGGGAVMEMIDQGLEGVIENCSDPNMVTKAKRRLVLTIDIIPGSDRSLLSYDASVSTRLAGMDSVCGTADVIGVGKGAVAKLRQSAQIPMFDNVAPFQKQ